MKNLTALLIFIFFINAFAVAQINNIHSLPIIIPSATTDTYDNDVSINDANGDRIIARTVINPQTNTKDIVLTKLDANQNVLFRKEYNPQTNTRPLQLIANTLLEVDRGYILVGLCGPNLQLFATFIQNNGTIRWSYIYDHEPTSALHLDAMVVPSQTENEFIVTGSTISATPINRSVGTIFAVKIDFSGREIWANNYNNTVIDPDFPDVNRVSDMTYDSLTETFVIVGTTFVHVPRIHNCPYPTGYYYAIFVMSINTDGSIATNYKRLDAEQSFSEAYPVILSHRGDYILAYNGWNLHPFLPNGKEEALGVTRLNQNLDPIPNTSYLYTMKGLDRLDPTDISQHYSNKRHYDIIGKTIETSASSTWYLQLDNTLNISNSKRYNDDEIGDYPDMLMTPSGYTLVANVNDPYQLSNRAGMRITEIDYVGNSRCSKNTITEKFTDQFQVDTRIYARTRLSGGKRNLPLNVSTPQFRVDSCNR